MDIKKTITSFLIGVGVLTILGILLIIPLILLISIANIGSENIAEITIDGEITTQETPAGLLSGGVAGSESIANKINELNERDDIKALVIVVNSPGGSVVASKEIYNAINDFDKPKVIYFREVAASGGYLIATPCNWIVSEPNALTANIGSRMEIMSFYELMDNIGINTTNIKSGNNKDMGSPFREMTDEEQKIFEILVNETYNEFKEIVIQHRGSKLSNTEEIFDSRIMSGRQAYGHGLVDELGNKQDAIDKAVELAGIENPKIIKIPITPNTGMDGLLTQTISNFGEGVGYGFAQGVKQTNMYMQLNYK